VPQILGEMFFECPVGSRTFGWTEGHYLTTAGDLPAALTQMTALANVRVTLLGGGVSLPYIRVSDQLVYRDSQVVSYPPPAFAINPTPTTLQNVIINNTLFNNPGGVYSGIYTRDALGDINTKNQSGELRCDFPYSGLLLRLEGGTTFTSRRQLILRGNSDVVQYTSIDRPIIGSYPDRLANFERTLVGNPPGTSPYGFRALDTSGANQAYAVVSVSWAQDPTQGNLWVPTFTFLSAPPWVPGTLVRMSRVRLKDPFGNTISISRMLTVRTRVNTSDFTFNNLLSGTTYPILLAGGKTRAQQFVVLPYRKVLDRRWAKRDTGVPFDQPRGKAKAKKNTGSILAG
jgi:hypothetical protein